jgi:hypothetical protein
MFISNTSSPEVISAILVVQSDEKLELGIWDFGAFLKIVKQN